MSTIGRAVFKLGYEISPIILSDGIASAIPGGMLPIMVLTETAGLVLGLLSGDGLPSSLDDFMAHWKPLPGTTLLQNQMGNYPFASQATAANAIISQPLTISMLMNCPVQRPGGYTSKLATMSALQAVLNQHGNAGGTYIIATPSKIYTDCILVAVRDVSPPDTKQVQTAWQFDFIQPLVTLDAAQQVYSSLMSKIAGGNPISGQPSWSGLSSTVGGAVSGGIGNLIPSASNAIGSLASGIGGMFGG